MQAMATTLLALTILAAVKIAISAPLGDENSESCMQPSWPALISFCLFFARKCTRHHKSILSYQPGTSYLLQYCTILAPSPKSSATRPFYSSAQWPCLHQACSIWGNILFKSQLKFVRFGWPGNRGGVRQEEQFRQSTDPATGFLPLHWTRP